MRTVIASILLGLVSWYFVASSVGAVELSNPRTLAYYSRCDRPLEYAIGSIDPRFRITEDQLLIDVQKAAQLWNDIEGKPLFVYNPDAELKINMIYDTRQALSEQIGKLEQELHSKRKDLDPKIAEFERRSIEFQKNSAEFNAEVEYWNSQGGAPKEEYERLQTKQQELRNEAQLLNEMASRLNVSAQEFNKQVGSLDKTVSSFNQELQKRPEQGLYKPREQEIDIYLTASEEELIRTLAHELGHALGMDHVDDEQAIMYGYTSQVVAPSAADMQLLADVCSERPIARGVAEKLAYLVYTYVQNREDAH